MTSAAHLKEAAWHRRASRWAWGDPLGKLGHLSAARTHVLLARMLRTGERWLVAVDRAQRKGFAP